jgi:glycosyltransferase involved in cell wall biosynthesis
MVFPSRPAGEGMPGVLIEAGLSGVPVVATDVPGVRTIVVDGETGLIVPERDGAGLTTAVARLLDDDALRLRLGTTARQRCVEQFSIESVCRIWSGLIEPLLP